MKLLDLLSSLTGQLTQVQGVEKQLLQRRRIGIAGMMVALAAAIFQVLVIVGSAALKLLHKEALSVNEFIAFLGIPHVLIGGSVGLLALSVYLIYRWTGFLLKESAAPFRYTFWIEPFQPVDKTPDQRYMLEASDRFHLLHHDLMERLNDRIRRLSLLEVTSLSEAVKRMLTAHIHIDGHYTLRENKDDGEWIIHVMPRVRIGPPGKPATLANPIKYPLTQQASADPKAGRLSTGQYNQMIERVYSSVVTEIYKQVEADVREKLDLFPTARLQAVALFHEAEDFVHSNTIDAYDHARTLFEEALQRLYLNVRWLTDRLVKCPILLWRLRVRWTHLHARIQTGYAQCLIYRRVISGLSGRPMNPLFKIRAELEEAIQRLEQLHRRMIWYVPPLEPRFSRPLMTWWTFPKDSRLRRFFLRPRQELFEQQRRIFFDVLVVNALTHYFLGAINKAEALLQYARDVDPQRSEVDSGEVDPLYLLAAALIEPDLDREIALFRRATEMQRNFQIAHYYLAYSSEMRFRRENELTEARAKSILDDYDKVLTINPGNIAPLAAQGYILWLSRQFGEAKKKFEEGLEIKAIVAETFVGEIQYGLARISAEEGLVAAGKGDVNAAKESFHRSYDRYRQAIAADPRVGAYGSLAEGKASVLYYEYIGSDTLNRYESFQSVLKTFRDYEFHDNEPEPKSSSETENRDWKKILNTIYSFALNDYGNACLNYYFRFGDRTRLAQAIDAFEQALESDPHHTIARYNLCIAYLWDSSQDRDQDIQSYLKDISEKIPEWKDPVVLQARFLRNKVQVVKDKRRNLQASEKIKSEFESQMKQIQNDINSEMERLSSLMSQKPPLPEQKQGREASQAGARGGKGLGSEKEVFAERSDTIKSLERRLDQAKEDFNKASNRVKELGDELTRLQGEIAEGCSKGIEQIMRHTQIASLFEASRIANGGGERRIDYEDCERRINQLLSNRKIKWDELAEGAVEALRACAEILLYKEEDEGSPDETQKRQAPCRARMIEKLTDQILSSHYPEHLDVYRIQEQIFERLFTSTQDESYRHRKKACTDAIERTVSYWLAQDPIFYVSIVNWHYYYFDVSKHQEVLKKACDLQSGNDDYRHNLACFYKEQGDNLYERQEYTKAIDLYTIVLNNVESDHPSHRPDRAAICDVIGNAYFEQGEYHRAIESYRSAVVHFPEHAGYRFHLDKATVAADFGARALWPPAVTPIVVDIASDVVPYVVEPETENLQATVEKQMADMREAVHSAMGVHIPGVRFRDSGEWLGHGAYLIRINEIPIDSGSVLGDSRLFPGPAEALEAIDVSGWNATHPQTGESAFWISAEDWTKVEQAGLDLWNVTEYIVRHLDNVIRRHLGDLLGHQEVMMLVESQCPAVHRHLKAHSETLSRLVTVLKGLLNEGVPILPFEKVVERCIQHCEEGKESPAIVEEIRCLPEVRPRLPGNNEHYWFYQLGPHFETTVRQAVSGNGTQPVLALRPDQYQALVVAVQKVTQQSSAIALLTSDPSLRPFVKAMLQPFVVSREHQRSRPSGWPTLPILSREELRLGLEGRIIGEIDLNSPYRNGA